MFKAVFRPDELKSLPNRIVIDSPTSFPELAHYSPMEEEVEEIADIDEYAGPTADDLRREAEMFKVQWEEEKEAMISGAKAEADKIIEDAQKAAFNEIKRKTDEGQALKEQAQAESEMIIAEAKTQAAEIENQTRQTLESEIKEARNKGKEEGKEEGFAEGKAEVERLIERTQTVLERAQDKRAEILSETEQEIIDLVLLISRKVIKVLSENQRSVIVSNVVQALRKVKSKGDVRIRVNMNDLQMATDHKQEFIKLLEGANKVHVVEDTTVDSGGCIIETDFGEIDARISSQLAELENKILDISPIKSSIKGDGLKEASPPVADRVPALENELAASALMDIKKTPPQEPSYNHEGEQEEDMELSPVANAALTASAALAALTTMAVKGKRRADQMIVKGLEKVVDRRGK